MSFFERDLAEATRRSKLDSFPDDQLSEASRLSIQEQKKKNVSGHVSGRATHSPKKRDDERKSRFPKVKNADPAKVRAQLREAGEAHHAERIVCDDEKKAKPSSRVERPHFPYARVCGCSDCVAKRQAKKDKPIDELYPGIASPEAQYLHALGPFGLPENRHLLTQRSGGSSTSRFSDAEMKRMTEAIRLISESEDCARRGVPVDGKFPGVSPADMKLLCRQGYFGEVDPDHFYCVHALPAVARSTPRVRPSHGRPSYHGSGTSAAV